MTGCECVLRRNREHRTGGEAENGLRFRASRLWFPLRLRLARTGPRSCGLGRGLHRLRFRLVPDRRDRFGRCERQVANLGVFVLSGSVSAACSDRRDQCHNRKQRAHASHVSSPRRVFMSLSSHGPYLRERFTVPQNSRPVRTQLLCPGSQGRRGSGDPWLNPVPQKIRCQSLEPGGQHAEVS